MQSFDCTKYNRYGFTAKGQDCANVETILCQLQPTLNKRNRTITADQIPLLNFGIFADRKRLVLCDVKINWPPFGLNSTLLKSETRCLVRRGCR